MHKCESCGNKFQCTPENIHPSGRSLCAFCWNKPTIRKSRTNDGPDVLHQSHCKYPEEGCICRAWETSPLG